MFARGDDGVAFGPTADGVPPLATFVAGLVLCVQAIPQTASWLGVLAVRRADASLMGASSLD